jgi:hypothetical protein
LQLDVVFLKHMLSHYVKDDFLAEGANALTSLESLLNEVLKTAGNRCTDMDCVGQTKFLDPVTGVTSSIRTILRKFMKSASVRGADGGEPVEDIFSRFVFIEAKVEL